MAQASRSIARTAAGLARLVALLAALTVGLNLPPAHAHATVGAPAEGHAAAGAPAEGHAQADCGAHGAPSGGASHLPSALGDCSHHFHPLFRTTGLALQACAVDPAAPRDAQPSRQIFHSFDPPPPRAAA